MAKVSLRIYNQEIESMVERGQLDEAIAHCRHVLNTFPKNLETYRLLGKAYLEAKRYSEATDIFERVLMAMPDDFVAHVGMSIINDEQKSMDAAIWHMERAFEVQPSNAAIQAELQRLYGRRDGVEPPKIRLTRGALAHMYVQGELYPQAISEINSVLEEDPGRQDMQVLLARTYFHAGQKGEAAEMCSQLLRRYPYCFDANRVLIELLPQTEQGESTQVYRHRINELNPYSAFVTGSVFHVEEVADAAVSLERLEWDGRPVDMQPEWSNSLGIGKDDSVASTSHGGPTASHPHGDEPASAIGGMPIPTAGGEENIPDFLREAGWGEDTGTFQESPGTFEASEGTDGSPAEAIEEGDLPDWVKAMEPNNAGAEPVSQQAEQTTEDLTQDEVPDWLQGLGEAQASASDEQPKAEDGEVPDWLAGKQPDDVSKGETSEQEDELTPSSEELPDWLQAEGDATSEESIQESALDPPADMKESLAAQQIEEQESTALADVNANETEASGATVEEQDDAIAWLEGLASKHGAKSEELVTDPESRKETAPDWVQKAQSAEGQGEVEALVPEEAPSEAVEAAPPTEEVASTDAPISADNLGTSVEEQDDAVAWLEGLAAKQGADPEELVTDPEARKETAPDWVQKASETVMEDSSSVESSGTDEKPSESETDLMQHAREVGESLYAEMEEAQTKDTPPAKSDETGVWLRDLGEAADSNDEQAVEGDVSEWLAGLESDELGTGVVPEADADPQPELDAESDSSDWLRSLETEADSSNLEDVEPPSSETSRDDLPSWLSGLEEKDQGQLGSSETGDSLPEWLSAEDEQESAQPEPTSPKDWQPVVDEDKPEKPAPTDASPTHEAPTPVNLEQSSEPELEPASLSSGETYQEPVTRSRSGMTGMLSPAQEPLLVQAQNELTRSNIPDALESYGKLIKKGKMLDEVIFDLREALYRFPVEVSILQTLGDAYMRANRLQDALDSYTKAEELLR